MLGAEHIDSVSLGQDVDVGAEVGVLFGAVELVLCGCPVGTAQLTPVRSGPERGLDPILVEAEHPCGVVDIGVGLG